MVRTIIKPSNNILSVPIPDNLVGRELEVIAFAIDEPQQPEKENKLKPSEFAGKLSDEGYDALQKYVQKSRDEWNRNSF